MTLKIFYIGGVKSGKSRLAEQRALTLAADRNPQQKPFYVATADPNDASMRERIERHRRDRGDQFITLEAPKNLDQAIEKSLIDHQIPLHCGVILIDCLTLWLSNHLIAQWERSQQSISAAQLLTLEHTLTAAIEQLLDMPHSLIFVLNDVGSGLHAPTELGRQFTDLSGILSQKIAAKCDEVYYCIAGIGQRIQ